MFYLGCMIEVSDIIKEFVLLCFFYLVENKYFREWMWLSSYELFFFNLWMLFCNFFKCIFKDLLLIWLILVKKGF